MLNMSNIWMIASLLLLLKVTETYGTDLIDATANFMPSTESEFDHEITLQENSLSFHWNDVQDNVFECRLVHHASSRSMAPSWLGLGFFDTFTKRLSSPSPPVGGSDAVIGFASQHNVAKYRLGTDSAVLLTRQTLIEASIKQHYGDNGFVNTILTFSKQLTEMDETEVQLRSEGENVFLWAIGPSNQEMEQDIDWESVQHAAFTLDLEKVASTSRQEPSSSSSSTSTVESPSNEQQVESNSNTNNNKEQSVAISTGREPESTPNPQQEKTEEKATTAPQPTPKPSAANASSGKKTYIAAMICHNILAFLAMGVLSPFALIAAWFRTLVPSSWIYIHVFCNIGTCAFLTLAFITEQVTITLQGGKFFANSHQWIGLSLCTIVIFQIMNGFLRPPIEKRDGFQNDLRQCYLPQTPREVWHLSHKLTGVTILILGVVYIHTGLEDFARDYQVRSAVVIFWVYASLFATTMCALKLWVVIENLKARARELEEMRGDSLASSEGFHNNTSATGTSIHITPAHHDNFPLRSSEDVSFVP